METEPIEFDPNELGRSETQRCGYFHKNLLDLALANTFPVESALNYIERRNQVLSIVFPAVVTLQEAISKCSSQEEVFLLKLFGGLCFYKICLISEYYHCLAKKSDNTDRVYNSLIQYQRALCGFVNLIQWQCERASSVNLSLITHLHNDFDRLLNLSSQF